MTPPLSPLHIVTLGVRDLATSARFYEEQLGWTRSSASQESICFYQVGGIVVALFPHEQLAKDAALPIRPRNPEEFAGFSLAFNADSEAEVDAIFAKLREGGVQILKAPEKVFWGGYSGYFADPDGYAWEIAYNPFAEKSADGQLRLP